MKIYFLLALFLISKTVFGIAGIINLDLGVEGGTGKLRYQKSTMGTIAERYGYGSKAFAGVNFPFFGIFDIGAGASYYIYKNAVNEEARALGFTFASVIKHELTAIDYTANLIFFGWLEFYGGIGTYELVARSTTTITQANIKTGSYIETHIGKDKNGRTFGARLRIPIVPFFKIIADVDYHRFRFDKIDYTSQAFSDKNLALTTGQTSTITNYFLGAMFSF